jgi:radical SAM protein with 4Fe4S-binding SPASM domain
MMIGWTGGEPLLRSDLEELTEYAWSRRIRSNVTTNGVLLSQERAQRLIQAGCHTIQISLDGSTAERNRRIRGTTDEEFDQIVGAIRIAKGLGARVVMATLMGMENLDDAANMIELAKREGVDTIRFCGFTPTGRGKQIAVKERLLFSEVPTELLDFVRRAQNDTAINVNFDVGFGPVPPDFGFHECIAGVETFYLKAYGNVYPCTALAHQQFLVGNVRKQSLEEIWQSAEMRVMSGFPREEISEPCRTCDNFAGCHGACRGSALAHTNDIRAGFPLCLYHAEVKACRRG